MVESEKSFEIFEERHEVQTDAIKFKRLPWWFMTKPLTFHKNMVRYNLFQLSNYLNA